MSNFGSRSRRPSIRAVRPLGLPTCLVACSLLAVSGGSAQQTPPERIDSPYRWIERDVRLGLFGGYLVADRGNLDHGPGPTFVAGPRFRIRVSSPLSIEAGVAYGPADRWVIDPSVETGPAVIDTVASHWILPSAGVQLGLTGARTWNGIHPFLMIGGGLMISVKKEASERFEDPEETSLRYDPGTNPVVHFGGGLEVFPTDRIGVSLEARDNFVRIKSPDGWFAAEILQIINEAGAEAPKESQWTHNFEFTLSLWYYF